MSGEKMWEQRRERGKVLNYMPRIYNIREERNLETSTVWLTHSIQMQGQGLSQQSFYYSGLLEHGVVPPDDRLLTFRRNAVSASRATGSKKNSQLPLDCFIFEDERTAFFFISSETTNTTIVPYTRRPESPRVEKLLPLLLLQ
jgi:hypothetical protein